jgi:hypothetical protein
MFHEEGVEEINTHFVFNNFFFKLAVYKIKNLEEWGQDTDD